MQCNNQLSFAIVLAKVQKHPFLSILGPQCTVSLLYVYPILFVYLAFCSIVIPDCWYPIPVIVCLSTLEV